MASATVDACEICANSFNSDFYRSVALPCSHAFCLLCLVRLKASDKRQCPTCRRNWAGFEVPALPGVEDLAAVLQPDQEDGGEGTNKKGMFERCEKHSKPYEYWAKDIKEFYCTRCAAENRHVKIKLIENVIPQIEAALTAEITIVEKKIPTDLESLDKRHTDLVRNRNSVTKFMKAVQTLDDNFKREIEEIAYTKSKALGTIAGLTKLKRKLNTFETASDLNVAVACKSSLMKVAAHSSVPTSDLPQSLLSNIACSYVEEGRGDNPPSKAAFVDAVQKYGAKPPSPETVRAAEKLEGDDEWLIDHVNSEAALLALTDRQPGLLKLVARDDAREALPVAVLASAATGCEVRGIFLDTFYSATDTAQDEERLQHLTANKSLRLDQFYGHLDKARISTLPTTITELGLAIGSAADAAAVSSLRPWKGLNWLHVSVSSRVAAEDLKPLPSGAGKELYFPFLSDAGVDSVRPAIEALVPDLRLFELFFPKSQLTAAGARRLTQRLRGVKVGWRVSIEANGTWRPGAEEKESLEAELRSATGCCVVEWAINW